MITSKEIRTLDCGGATDLLCPRCGADLLHHVGVEIYERWEDEEQVLKLTQTVVGFVEGQKTSTTTAVVPSKGSGNPSSRRNGLAIQFACESCGGGVGDDRIEMTIAQHKGATEIGWRFTPRNG